MTKLTYKRTHRLLQRASDEDFNYHTVEIDITNGLFNKTEVDSKDTLIRVNNGVFGEAFNPVKNVALTVKQIKKLQDEFNAVRAERDWHPVEFRTTKEVDKVDKDSLPEEFKSLVEEIKNEVSSPSEVQGQEEAEAVQE